MATTEHDLERLRRAVALAAKGRFAVEPNPVVGCVVEKEGRVVGEGWHASFGGAHAEESALAIAGNSARGATAYVSLEPCTADVPAKRRPPCADALVAAGVSRVVYASEDPHPAVRGRGAARLRSAGLTVVGPVPAAEGDLALEPFRRALALDRPWTVLKWAMSWDGRIAPALGAGGRLTGPRAQALAQEMRGRADAVAVGVGTVLADDPLLTCRLPGGPPDGRPQPLRVVFDSTLRTPPRSRLLEEGDSPVLFVTARASEAARRAIEALRAEVWEHPGADGRVEIGAALARLAREKGVRRLLVEGGGLLHGSFLRHGLVDQVAAFVAPRILGAHGAPTPVEDSGFADLDVAPRLELPAWRGLGEDVLLQGYAPRTWPPT